MTHEAGTRDARPRARTLTGLAVVLLAVTPLLLPLGATAAVPASPGSASIPPQVRPFGDDSVRPPAGTAPLRRADRARAVTPTTYDIRAFTMATADGAVSLSAAQITELVNAIDAWFARTTNGALRFRLVGPAQALPAYADSVCALEPAADALAPYLPLAPTAGARDVVWLAFTPDRPPDECGTAGMGYLGAPGVWMSQGEDLAERVRVLTHELGHNLGLAHSQAVVSRGTVPSWPAGDSPVLDEYGDTLDAMGIGGFWACPAACGWQQADFHAHNLNLLGLLPASDVTFVGPGVSREVVLAPVDATSGVRAAYLPWLDRGKFVLDFRPPSYLSGNAAMAGGPGAGVVIRLVDSDPDAGPDPYAFGGGTAALSVGTAATETNVQRIGMVAGAEQLLPDGTTVRVVAVSQTDARILVTRPADTTPPQLGADTLGGCVALSCTVPADRALWDNGRATYDLPLTATDNVWLQSLSVAAVNGTSTTRVEGQRPAPGLRAPSGTPLPRLLTLPSGRYAVTATATDIGGRQATQAWDLTLPPAVAATSWNRYTNALSYAWPEWESLRCYVNGANCLGLAVRANSMCRLGLRATLVSLRDDRSVIESRQVRVGRLRAGQSTVMVATFSGPAAEVDNYNFTSLACRR